ncbi:FadR/GntR family transcriptional regulator [Arthrobacter crystallopoietes]|uniref:DNA-binding transcriptional regulator, FadR family n=1 Tax=Crystallibacter crystallopoietes TaxID=37928 RepID=A0A1H1AMZ1_9MICC|nr:FCD domain-containing protein [Arthrobacter crystallopoietes]AUI51483.1 transcriptional regulator [Arthrobacter crystallopoietes]SDQ40566.1 DNA-binding transcriptional regulator, FadR family [Arthrobacter crystallopoietes]
MASPPALQSQIYRSLPEKERSEAIVQRISTAIALGMLRVGERLPVESELSDMFGVAGATLREALAELRERGVVETRRGRNGGTFVVKSPAAQEQQLRKYLRDTSIADLRDLGDEQTAVAAAAARLACDRAHPKDLDRLEQLAKALAGADSPETQARSDSRFHIELAVVAQSPRLTSLEIRLQSEVGQLLWSPIAGVFDPATAAREHVRIVDAIRADEPDDAQRLVVEHIRRNTYHLIDTKLTLAHAGDEQEIS